MKRPGQLITRLCLKHSGTEVWAALGTETNEQTWIIKAKHMPR